MLATRGRHLLRMLTASLLPAVLALGWLAAHPVQALSAGPAEPTSAESSRSRLPLGIYDPDKRFKRKKRMSYEHLFIDWTDWHEIWLRDKVRYAAKRGRGILLTVEPWVRGSSKKSSGKTLFDDVANGAYDEHITLICTEVAAIGGKPLVRWGHEMEEVTGRYPWARKDSAGYISVGPIFKTNTKEKVCDPVGLKYLEYAVANVPVPFVAIGGIKEHNIREIKNKGAKTIALVTEIVGADDIAEKVKKIRKMIMN